jgi:hypothetical protein
VDGENSAERGREREEAEKEKRRQREKGDKDKRRPGEYKAERKEMSEDR